MPVLVAVVAYVVNGLGGLVDWLAPVQKLSPFYRTAPTTRCGTVCRGRRSASGAGTVVLLVAVAAAGFDRRDVTT